MDDVLVIGYGNPGRCDDGLGALVGDAVERAELPGVEVVTAYQLNVEHAADAAGHRTVVFADAAVGGRSPCFLRRLLPRRAAAFTTHAMRPEAVLALADETFGWSGDAYLLGVRGHEFNEFGEGLSETAEENLRVACGMLIGALRRGELDGAVTDPPTDDSATPCYGGGPCATAST